MTIFSFEIWWITLAPTWYGVMYAVSFLIGLYLMGREFSERDTDTLFFATVLGVIIWGRLGYVFFYNLGYYLENPLEVLMPWKGGMSFHGGAAWVILSWYIASRKIKKSFRKVSDQLVWIVPIGLFFGRIGNYINGELMWIPGYSWILARNIGGINYFPTPLLEAFLEWIILFLMLVWKKKKIDYPGQLGIWFIGGYGIMRFWIEFLRTPDVQIGYLLGGWMTMGHVLSLIMIIFALVVGKILKRKE